MIIFAEPFMTGAQHAAFNAAMLQVWCKTYPQEELIFFSSAPHWQNIQQHLAVNTKCSVKIIDVVSNKTGSKRTWIRKFINESRQIIKILRQAQRCRATYLCFSFLSPLGHYLLNTYLKFFKARLQVLVILHGLEILKPSKQVKKIDKFYANLLTGTFRNTVPNMRYLVLEQSAKDYLIKKELIAKNKLIYIPHPYIFPPDIKPKPKHNSVLTFGHIGLARLDKQSNKFFELAAYFKQDVIDGNASFQIIGAVLPEMEPFLNEYVHFSLTESMLSRAAYETRLQALDYAVFSYAADAYELTSSGALIDAIAFQKPIIALRNKSFEQVFQLTEIKPGYLFDNMESLTTFIQQLIQQPINNHSFKEAFLTLQAHYSIANVASLLFNALASDQEENYNKRNP